MTKLTGLRTAAATKELDALLITSAKNRRYLSGFTGSSGALLITDRDAFLITDFRYTNRRLIRRKVLISSNISVRFTKRQRQKPENLD